VHFQKNRKRKNGCNILGSRVHPRGPKPCPVGALKENIGDRKRPELSILTEGKQWRPKGKTEFKIRGLWG